MLLIPLKSEMAKGEGMDIFLLREARRGRETGSPQIPSREKAKIPHSPFPMGGRGTNPISASFIPYGTAHFRPTTSAFPSLPKLVSAPPSSLPPDSTDPFVARKGWSNLKVFDADGSNYRCNVWGCANFQLTTCPDYLEYPTK